MDEVKWAWVLLVAATLALLIRLAMWFLPGPAEKHSEKVVAAAEEATGAAPAAEVASAPAPAWPDEAAEQDDWLPPPAPAENVRPPPAPPAEPAPPPEEFHFRRTRWGMSLDEVRASETGVPLRENERGLMYAVTTLELPSLLTYSFVQGGLARARLSFSDPTGRDIPPLTVAQAQRRYLYLREQLRSRYGEPIEKTVHATRDVSDLQRGVRKQDELARQYDVEIAEAEQRLQKQRGVLENRYSRWPNRDELVARGLAPYERDLRELRSWKQEAVDLGARSRQSIRRNQAADSTHPLIASMSARWPYARGLHDIELRLDCGSATPRLDIRYEATQNLPDPGQMNEL